MEDLDQIEQVRSFVRRYANMELFSTGARLVDFTGVLYNVTGSTADPRAVRDHKGASWKALLLRYPGFSNATCYVTDPLPDEESSHPAFAVGGHMTPNPSGRVDVGGVTYLMPLCKWHNSTGRDGTAFHHDETKMLKLTGFMEGDSGVTFALRMENDSKYTKLFFDEGAGDWAFQKVPDDDAIAFLQQPKLSVAALRLTDEYAIFEKRGDRFVIALAGIGPGRSGAIQ